MLGMALGLAPVSLCRTPRHSPHHPLGGPNLWRHVLRSIVEVSRFYDRKRDDIGTIGEGIPFKISPFFEGWG